MNHFSVEKLQSLDPRWIKFTCVTDMFKQTEHSQNTETGNLPFPRTDGGMRQLLDLKHISSAFRFPSLKKRVLTWLDSHEDLKDAFFHIPVAPEQLFPEIYCTCDNTAYEFRILPYGLYPHTVSGNAWRQQYPPSRRREFASSCP